MKTKLGISHDFGGGTDTLAWLQFCTGATFVGDLGIAQEAPFDCLAVGRMDDMGQLEGQGFDANRYAGELSPGEAVDMYLAWLQFYIDHNPHIWVWCGPNEQTIRTQSVMGWYAAFCKEFARRLWLQGKRAAIGGWATGNPEHNLWPFWTEALEGCRHYGAYYMRHCYGPVVRPDGTPDTDNGLRYREDYRHFARLGYGDVRMVLTEVGADDAGGMHRWRDYFGGNIGRYWNELLLPLARCLEEDEYVEYASVFCSGGEGRWAGFDVAGTGLVDKVRDAVGSAATLPERVPIVIHTLIIEQVPAAHALAYIEHLNAMTAHVNAGNAPYVYGPPKAWWEIPALPFVTVAKALPLTTYSAAAGPVHDVRPGATYDLGVIDRTWVNGVGWLKVAPLPLWVKADDVRLK